MKEIRWHGRGGNGGFTAARLLGFAASVFSGKYGQAFPSFGPERRGAPVLGFTRIDDEPITDHSQIYSCDCVIVLDETLIDVVDVVKGLKSDGVLLINSLKMPEDFQGRKEFAGVNHLVTIDGTSLAVEILGVPIVNTVMLGGVVGSTGLVSIESVEKAIDAFMPVNLRQKNKRAVRIAYETVKGGQPL